MSCERNLCLSKVPKILYVLPFSVRSAMNMVLILICCVRLGSRVTFSKCISNWHSNIYLKKSPPCIAVTSLSKYPCSCVVALSFENMKLRWTKQYSVVLYVCVCTCACLFWFYWNILHIWKNSLILDMDFTNHIQS